MPTAFILLNTEIGAETTVVAELKKIKGVKEAHNLWGVYDVIASVTAENMESLRNIITNQIEKIQRVNSKLTMVVTEKPLNSQKASEAFMIAAAASPLIY